MSRHPIRTISAWLALLALAGAVPPRPQARRPAHTAVAILVNPGTRTSNLSLAELRAIMLGNRQFWPDNQPIVLLVRAPVTPERTAVLHIIYQMSEAEFRQYWIAKIFRDETATAPKIVYSASMTNELVVAIPNAIAFLAADEVQPGPKVLTIDGKKPGEKGYPLQ
ncbi:MAG TPA: hypothetical protein VN690_01815 [Terriglobales bacterium]|nr:hypothetical protein [Terriglobales bacterium]